MDKQLRDFRITEELQIILLKTIQNFKSKEHPRSKLKPYHIDRALSSILHKRIQRRK